jgi:hypothetical protein
VFVEEEFQMRLFNSLAVATVVVAAAAFIPQTASAERVCRQDCVGPVCQERCVETEGRGDRREGREERRDIRRDGREERRERGPGIELRVPGVDVEIGR